MKRGFLNTKKARTAPVVSTNPASSGGSEQLGVRAQSPEKAYSPEGDVVGDVQIAVNATLKRPAIITTIPFPSPGTVNDAEACQIVTITQTKDMLLKNRALHKAIPTSSRPKYAVQETTDMGLGLFATADISFGERILAERPYVVLPKNIGQAFSIPQAGSTPDHDREWHECCMDEAEKLLTLAVERMGTYEADQLKSRCNISSEDPEKRPLTSILVACGMNLGLEDASGVQGFGNGYIGIPRLGSRINHSCVPNAVFDFDPDSFSILYTATRKIKSGDQIFLAYVPVAMPLAQRRQAMARYKFICQCDACANATTESDKLRRSFHLDLNDIARSVSTASGRTPATRDLMNRTLRLKAAMEKEGLESEPRFSEVYAALTRLSQLMGDMGGVEDCKRKLEVYMTFPGYQKAMKMMGMRV